MRKAGFFERVINDPRFPYYIFFAGLAYLAFLASSIQPDVFMQGDGGMKFIVIKQLVAGEGFKILHLPHADWVHDVWNQGFFPIKIPFLYESPEGMVIVFPPGMQLVSSVFYKQFGYAGLYILPLLATVVVWYGTLLLLRQSGVRPAISGLAMFTLIFCTPLTVYGVTYWEHMPADGFLMAGLAYLVRKKTSPFLAVVLGFLSGIAVWLRPEAMVMNLLYTAAAFIQYRANDKKAFRFFVAGLFVSFYGFLFFNKAVYDHWLGVHGNQVMEVYSWSYKLLRALKYDLVLGWLLVRFFVPVLLLAPALWCIFRLKWKINRLTKVLFAIVVIFLLCSSVMFPNTGGGQWGPRYYMVIIPPAILLLAFLAEQWRHLLSKRAIIALTIFLIIGNGIGIYQNVYRGGMIAIRHDNRHRITPALNFVRQQPDSAIVVNIEHITMEMGAIFKERNIFMAETDSALHRLMPALKQKGVNEFLYIVDHDESPGMPNKLNNDQTTLVKHGKYYFGRYNTE